MDETTLKIAIAAFLHDIGKFADKDVFNISKEYLNNNADLYQPHKNGIYTHAHALYTAAFIEHMEKFLPKQFNSANWGLEDSFINLAAGHHNPTTPMQWVVAMADRIGSGWDREKFDTEYNHAIAWKDYRQTRLLPIFERVMSNEGDETETSDKYNYCYPLKEMSPENIFPGEKNKLYPKDNKDAIEEYKNLFNDFISELDHLLHREENIELWFEHFVSLMMVFTSNIPAARAGNIIPDVSLFDHSKITAALAVAIYLYHRDTSTLTIDEIKGYDTKQFLLISGNFYGIQNFIFSDSGEAGTNRAKILRGRSFAVSLFSELAADMLCRQIEIPSSSILLDAAGKFTLIAPNTTKVKEAIDTVEIEVNKWLINVSFGETSMGITYLEASGEDLVEGKFAEIWDSLNEKMEIKKFQKIGLAISGGAFEDYLDSFHNNLHKPLCPFCGKRPSDPQLENSKHAADNKSICKICRDHVFLGENLVKKTRLAITTNDAEIKGSDKLLEPIFGKYQVAFVDGGMKELARSKKLLKYWDISINSKGTVSKDVTAKFINGYVPVYQDEDLNDDRILFGGKSEEKKEELIDEIREGTPKTFEHIANKALNPKKNGAGYCGIEALGILKADVDKLGLLMSCGLKQKQFTISRLATLSRQLNSYFSIYLPHLLKTNPHFIDIYTVFSGGDDLFLIGPWNRIIELTYLLRQSFSDYVCGNIEIHFSAGISIHKPHIPLDKLSGAAETAIETSKESGRNRITLFSETVDWEDFFKLKEIKETLEEWREKELINNAMIYRLNDFIDMAELERCITSDNQEIYLEDMDCLKWRSLFSYSTSRNVGKGLKEEDKNNLLREFSRVAKWLEDYRGRLKIALWDVIYNHR